jgi:hypothetical protein
MKLLSAVVLVFWLSAPAFGAEDQPTGVFSNMYFGTEDVNGMEMFVLNSNDGYFALIQCAEGSPSRPVLVPVSIAGPFIDFSIRNEPASHCPKTRFKGKISATGIKGNFEGTNYPGMLKRKKSYWQ